MSYADEFWGNTPSASNAPSAPTVPTVAPSNGDQNYGDAFWGNSTTPSSPSFSKPVSTSPFNPNTPGHAEFNAQLDQRIPKPGIFNNLSGSDFTQAGKQVGKLASDLPVGMYNQFAHPSEDEQHIEKSFDNGVPLFNGPAKAFTRFVEPMVEGLGHDIANEQTTRLQAQSAAQDTTKQTVGKQSQGVGQENLNTKPLSAQEKLNTVLNAANFVTAVAGGVKGQDAASEYGKTLWTQDNILYKSKDAATFSSTPSPKAQPANLAGMNFLEVPKEDFGSALSDPEIRQKYDGIKFQNNGGTETLPFNNTAESALTVAMPDGNKYYVKLTPDQLANVYEETRNIPQAQNGDPQIHLDPLNDKLLTQAKEVPAEDFANLTKDAFDVVQKLDGPRRVTMQLNSGFDPGVDKFIAEDVKPAIEQTKAVAATLTRGVQSFKDAITNIIEPAKAVEKSLGTDVYSDVIRAIHTPEAERVTFDNNFKEAEKYFDKFSKSDLDTFNQTRGDARSEAGKSLQDAAQNNIPEVLKSPELKAAIQKASDYVFNLGKQMKLDISYLEDYFYGAYKDSTKVGNFLDHWQSTERFTKEKTLPTIADANAYGLELKDPNPIRNIKSELDAVSKRGALLKLRDDFLAKGNLLVDSTSATPEQLSQLSKIEDPVFKGYLADPKLSRLVNNLIETNKISQTGLLRGLRTVNRLAQQVKFTGSAFHLFNEFKASIAQEMGGVLDPRGYQDFAGSFKGIDKTDPVYKEYVNLGGGHSYSIEGEAASNLSQAFDKALRGNYLGSATNAVAGVVKLPANFVSWMFEDMIPKLKFEKFQQDVTGRESKLSRPLTDAEKIDIIKRNQNFYGEMNERLFGRSATVTSALRLLFTAPGYGEGNFRVLGKAATGDMLSARFIANSLATTLVTATVGTKLLTGNWPNAPKSSNDLRDLFKIKTNLQDGNGDAVYYDLMTYDKDYWSTLGNVVTGQPARILPDLTKRVSGMTSSPAKILTDLTALFEGKNIVDYKNDPIFYSTDTLAEKTQKLIKYEAKELSPISLSTLQTATQKGASPLAATAAAVSGMRPTTSENVKDTKAKINDFYTLQDVKNKKQMELDKLAHENPEEAVKQAREFNDGQQKKLNELFRGNATKISPGELHKFTIENLHLKDKPQGTSLENVLK